MPNTTKKSKPGKKKTRYAKFVIRNLRKTATIKKDEHVLIWMLPHGWPPAENVTCISSQIENGREKWVIWFTE